MPEVALLNLEPALLVPSLSEALGPLLPDEEQPEPEPGRLDEMVGMSDPEPPLGVVVG